MELQEGTKSIIKLVLVILSVIRYCNIAEQILEKNADQGIFVYLMHTVPLN